MLVSSSLCLVHCFPPDDGTQHLGGQHLLGSHGGHILVKNNEIRQHSGDKFAFLLLLKLGEGGSGGVRSNCLIDGDFLFGKILECAFLTLARYRSIQTAKGSDWFDRIVGSERQRYAFIQKLSQ